MSNESRSGRHTAASLANVLETDYNLEGGGRLYLSGHEWKLVLTALRSEIAEPSGWKLVPVEPTLEMKEAGGKYRDQCKETYQPRTVGGYYRAMLAAAPAHPNRQNGAD